MAQDLWIAAQFKAPASVQRSVIPRLHTVKEIVRLLAWPYLPVYRMQGQSQGGPLTVDYVGLDFTKPFLKSILFEGDPGRSRLRRFLSGATTRLRSRRQVTSSLWRLPDI